MTNTMTMDGYFEITAAQYGLVGDKTCGGRYYRPEGPSKGVRTRAPREVYQGEDSCVCQAEGY